MPLERRKCTGCEARYDVILVRGVAIGLDREDDKPTCPGCDGNEFIRMVGVGTGVELGDVGGAGKIYPYFDRAMGITLNSAKHRREECKKRGLLPIDGDIDLDADHAKEGAWRQGVIDRNKAWADQLAHDPEYAQVRELTDKGYFNDRAERHRKEKR